MKSSSPKTLWIWSRLTSSKWEDAWLERLRFLDPQCLVVTALQGNKSVRIEACGIDHAMARILESTFGGSVRECKEDAWLAAQSPALAPILIRDAIVLTPEESTADRMRLRFPARRILLMPGSMAFGTGDHPTTSTCLRWVVDFAKTATPGWSHLDAGTGTGVLCLAAKSLGAAMVEGFDFDPHAVRTAKANAQSNGIKKVRFLKRDIRKWEPARPFDLVTANLYSGLLVESAPKLLAATRPGGTLILSGILRSQENDVLAAFRKTRLKTPDAVLRKGKWVTLRYVNPGFSRKLRKPLLDVD